MKDKILVDICDNGSFKLNMSSGFVPKKQDVLLFSDGQYVVTKVYRFKRIRMFLVKLGFNVCFYEIKRVVNGK